MNSKFCRLSAVITESFFFSNNPIFPMPERVESLQFRHEHNVGLHESTSDPRIPGFSSRHLQQQAAGPGMKNECQRNRIARSYSLASIFFILTVLIVSVPSFAQPAAPMSSRSSSVDKPAVPVPAAIDTKSLGDIKGGVVANQTITTIGTDFYQYFVAGWRDKDADDSYALAIHERPSARLGSQVWIQFGQRKVFQTFLPPARASIKPISEQAVEIVYQAVVDADVQKMLFRDPDLGRDEM